MTRMTTEHGGTLLETMIAAFLCCLLVLAWGELLQSIQSACIAAVEASRIQTGVRVAHRALWLSICQAGQNQPRSSVELSESGVLSIASDLNGPAGDPDNSLEQEFERQSFRLDPDFAPQMSGAAFDQAANLQWKSGAGNFQPFVTHLTGIQHRLIRGRSGTRSISTTLRMRGRFTGLRRGAVPGRSFVFDFPLEKNREQWFRYDVEQN